MNWNLIHEFRRKLADGQSVIGPFCKTLDPAMIEAMGLGGMDFVILDMEHGPQSLPSLSPLILAAESAGVMPIVRVPENGWEMIGAALDLGAAGVQIPKIESAAAAQRAVQKARFAPLGERGVCRYVRAAQFSAMDKEEYFRSANTALLALQLEGCEAFANLAEILGVGGVDVLFIGPYDLSQSLGVPGQVDHPEVVSRIREVVARCQAHGMVVGTFVDDRRSARFWREQGVRYIGYSVDVGLMYRACREAATEFRHAG